MDATDTVKQQFRIPDENLAALQERLAKLSKKAQKLCGVGITLTVVRVDDVEQMKAAFNEAGGFLRDAEGKQVVVGTGVFDRYHVVTVEGPRPKLNGWTLAAALDTVDADGEQMVLVRCAPGMAIPENYRQDLTGDCDHCRTRRHRKTRYVLVSDAGEHKVVGSNCLADFLGHRDPEELVKFFEYLADAMADAMGSERGGGGGMRYFGLSQFLDYVAANIRADGWLSRTNARNMGREGAATADIAMGAMIDRLRGKEIKPEYKPTEADRARADKAVEFMTGFLEAHGEDNDYLHNLKVTLKVGVVDWKLAGLAGSIIPTAEREMGKEVERRQFANLKATSKYFGEVKEKLFVKATVTGVRELDSQFGVTTMVKFVTADGNAATWFASGSKAEEWEVGTAYTLAATVKKHEEYQGLKQTVLTRVVAVTDVFVAEEKAKAEKKAARAAAKAAKAAKL